LNNKTKKYIEWIPLIVSLVTAFGVLLVYSIITVDRVEKVYSQVLFSCLVPAIVPILGRINKRPYPLFFNIMITSHVIMAVHLGTGLGFYELIPFWDLIMHGYFGFVSSMIAYVLLIRCNGDMLTKTAFFIIIFLSTMGCAALWEIYEFASDFLFRNDSQKVLELLSLGKNPILDTMTDIIIAAAGVVAFYVFFIIDKKRGFVFTHKVYEHRKITSKVKPVKNKTFILDVSNAVDDEDFEQNLYET